MVIDKPAGLASQPGEGVGSSVVSLLQKQLERQVFPIHRLDKDTAGCMMLATSSAAASQWSAKLGEGGAGKLYWAVCSGAPERGKGVYRDPLTLRDKTQDAETRYTLISRFGSASFSLVEFSLGTGRTHQIRRHCALHGHPIVGDDRYGDFALNRRLKKEVQAKRLLLWAWGLRLPGIGLVISSIPNHFSDFIQRWDDAPPIGDILALREVQ